MRHLILTDVDGLSDNTEPALIVLMISHSEINTGNIASVLERLHVLTDSAENIHRYRESLVFQVGGYDADPRELPEIPEVRAFFRRLVAEWPHWLWFMPRGFGSISLLFALLCEVQVLRNPDGSYGTEFISRNELANQLRDMLSRGNALFATYGVSIEEAGKSADSAVDELLGG